MKRWSPGILLLALPVLGHATTYHVPADYERIQGALNVAGVGDTVLVAPGTYSDYTIVNGDAIVGWLPDGVVLMSEAGPEQTIIDLAPVDGIGQAAFAVVHHTSGQTVIDGFRTINPRPYTGGVSVGATSFVEIRNCVFEGVDPPDPDVLRLGIGASSSNLRVVDCTFVHCSAHAGAGISMLNGSLVVESCEFFECANQGIRVAVQDYDGTPYSLEVRNSVFDHISAIPSSGGISGGCILASALSGTMLVEGCVFHAPLLTSATSGSVGAAIAMGGGTVSNLVEKHKWRSLRVLTHPAPDGARRTGELRHGARYHVRRRRPIPS